ncbi:MAG: ComEC/Rec2 family competence protein [Candidatus Magasanikbacteria bacterium]|nr:ComEC/Rec2 family competence protein [Candidatus Magasanikbacteria bacterium]
MFAIVFSGRRSIYLLFLAFLLLGVARFITMLPHSTITTIDRRGVVQHVQPERFGAVSLIVDFGDAEQLLLRSVRGTFSYGDAVRVVCVPGMIEDTRGAPLDFSLASRGVFFECAKSRITLVEHNEGNPVLSALYRFRDTLQRMTHHFLSEPASSLFSGILLGIQETIPVPLKQAFVRTSLVHILVVSGSHMVILGEYLTLFFLLFGFSPRVRGILTLVILFLFVASIGFPASAVRGFWFAVLLTLAMILGRMRVVTTALLGTAGIMIFWNPFLIRDVGFQLSFLATIGIGIVAPRVALLWERFRAWLETWRSTPRVHKKRKQTWFHEVVVRPCIQFFSQTTFATIGAIIMTAPLIASTFGQFSLVAPFANVVVLWILQPMMALGIIFLLVAWLTPLAWMMATMLTALLQLIVIVVQFFGSFPFAQITMERSWMISIVLYSVIFLWIRKSNPR